MRRPWTLACVLLVTVTLSGCLDPYRPVVPETTLGDADHAWTVIRSNPENNGVFGPNTVETEIRYDGDEGGYPGFLLLVGIRTLSRIPTEDLLERTRSIVEQVLVDNGVDLDSAQEASGSRTLRNGAVTSWFSLTGVASSDGVLFADDEEIKVLGETWYDGRSKTHVVAVALAQTTDTNFLGDEQRDHAVWNELVGDRTGSVGGARSNHGFIDHVRSH